MYTSKNASGSRLSLRTATLVHLGLVFQLIVLPVSSWADEAAAPSGSESGSAVVETAADADDLGNAATLGAYPYRPYQSFKHGFGSFFDKQNQFTIAVAAATFAGARMLDEEAQEYFFRKERLGPLDDWGNHVLGTGVPGTLLGAGFWLIGDLIDRPYAIHAGQAQLEALLVTGVLTAVTKGAFNRERPDGSDRYSLPSGHTSTVFASAMVLQEFYGWKAGAPVFLLGALTAASRMSDNRHWFSDTVAGATLGIMVGHAFSQSHLDRIRGFAGKEKNVKIYPVLEKGGGRLVFSMNF